MATEIWHVKDVQGNMHITEINPNSADDALYFLRFLRRLTPGQYNGIPVQVTQRVES